MGIDKFNSEGYYDPTSYEALTNVTKADKHAAFRPLVYICSPFSGDTEYNTEQARKYSRFAYEQNVIPVTPHLLYPQFMSDNDSEERADALYFNCVLLGKCSELWVFGDVITKGMAHEIDVAKKRKQTIRWFNKKCEEVSR